MSTSTSPDAARIIKAVRGPIIIAVLIVLSALAVTLLRGERRNGELDPRAASPQGSKAIARLLENRGVNVVFTNKLDATTAQLNAGSTLVLPFPGRLADEQLAALAAAGPGRTVLIGPDRPALTALAPGVRLRDHASDVHTLKPECTLPAATAAGDADLGGRRYEAPAGATGCYIPDWNPSLVVTDKATVVGSGSFLTNEKLDDHGNAALALNLLGTHPKVVWYIPTDAGVVPNGDKSVFELVPDGWKFGTLQLAIAVVLLALWRARRLGPVVAEPLPVVVRATETVEGRARLYRRAGARDRAAELLRGAARDRLTKRLNTVAPSTDPQALAALLVSEVATRTNRPPADVSALLYGPVPDNDASLVRLADDLYALQNEVHSGSTTQP